MTLNRDPSEPEAPRLEAVFGWESPPRSITTLGATVAIAAGHCVHVIDFEGAECARVVLGRPLAAATALDATRLIALFDDLRVAEVDLSTGSVTERPDLKGICAIEVLPDSQHAVVQRGVRLSLVRLEDGSEVRAHGSGHNALCVSPELQSASPREMPWWLICECDRSTTALPRSSLREMGRVCSCALAT